MTNVKQKHELTYPCMWCDKEVPITEQQRDRMLSSSFVLLCDDCERRPKKLRVPLEPIEENKDA